MAGVGRTSELVGSAMIDAHAMYREAFTDVSKLAAQQHMMTPIEFAKVAMDPAITKYVALDSERTIIGLGVMTDDLSAWPLVSPEFFANRWPAQYEERRIFYVGFVCTRPGAPLSTFRDILAAMTEVIIAHRGIAIMDWCAHNVEERKLASAVTRMLGRMHEGTVGQEIDRQSFWAYRFDGEEMGAA
jgi:hypothetical protein